MKWKLKKQFRFEAAHRLPFHDGKCARLHGHSWAGWVELESKPGTTLHEEGPKQGMLMDYSDVGALVKPMVEEYLDHHFLNETLELESPTSELIAKWVYEHLREGMPQDCRLSITIEETCTCSCTYSPELENRVPTFGTLSAGSM